MGTAVETAAVLWLLDNGFPRAERLALAGKADRGDIRLQILPTIIAECKRAQRGVQLTPWMRELAAETKNASAAYGLLIAKQKGVGDRNVARWVAAMWWENFWPLFDHHLKTASERAGSQRWSGGATPEDWYLTEQWSPTKINTTYVPMLTAREHRLRSAPSGWGRVPFAITYTPGNPDQRMVVGPLEQFVTLLRNFGFGDDPVAREGTT